MHLTAISRTAALRVLAAAITSPWLGLPPSAKAATYSFTDLSANQFMETLGYGISGGQQVGYGYDPDQSGDHALLWSGTAGSVVDLHPSGFTYSYARGISGRQQVGFGGPSAPDQGIHALLWSGAADTAVDLHPSGFLRSYAFGTSGSQQAGFGYLTEDSFHALLWSGSASSAVDLNPSGFTRSEAYGISGSQQVGYGAGAATGGDNHALLWSGSASSAVDLNPSGFTTSLANADSDGQQVGYGAGAATGGHNHALLWSGSAGSAVDLNPVGITASWCFATSGSEQVGYGYGPATGNGDHALVWSGTAASAVDLKSFLSSDYGFCYARGIDENGNIVGYANHIPTGQIHAILWTPVPEPPAGSLLALGAAAYVLHRRYRYGSDRSGPEDNGALCPSAEAGSLPASSGPAHPALLATGGMPGEEGRRKDLLRRLGARHDPRPDRPRTACGGSRVSAGRRISGAVPAIGNEPGRHIQPVASGVRVRPPDIALFLAFPA